MLSRIADSLFWLNRYMERADSLLRVMKTNYILSLDKGVNSNLTWRPMLEIFTYADEQQIKVLENDTDTTMPRGHGWSFMNLGRCMERCTQTIEITDKQYRSIDYDLTKTVDILQWRYLLLSLSGYELHLKTYHSSDVNKDVLHQVLINPNFTRSVFYSLTRIERYLDEAVKENKSAENESLQRFFGRLYSSVKYADP